MSMRPFHAWFLSDPPVELHLSCLFSAATHRAQLFNLRRETAVARLLNPDACLLQGGDAVEFAAVHPDNGEVLCLEGVVQWRGRGELTGFLRIAFVGPRRVALSRETKLEEVNRFLE